MCRWCPGSSCRIPLAARSLSPKCQVFPLAGAPLRRPSGSVPAPGRRVGGGQDMPDLQGLRRRLPMIAAFGAAVLLLPAAVPGADAAAPSSGTVTSASPTVTWTAGPFAAPNVTGNVGDPVCTPTTCDDFTLKVTT